ncbi:MAG: DUF3365 domain-containing protein [Pirellulales bacterium]
MKSRFFAGGCVLLAGACWFSLSADEPSASATPYQAATNSREARSRAMLLHESVNGTLKIMHRDFVDADNAHAIPSASMEDVFHELEKAYDVKMSWLTVNTDVVNFEHQAKTEFEKEAVNSLASGKPFVEQLDKDRYRFAGAIRLGSQCLKCHLQLRSSNEDRTAGIVISMPIQAKP